MVNLPTSTQTDSRYDSPTWTMLADMTHFPVLFLLPCYALLILKGLLLEMWRPLLAVIVTSYITMVIVCSDKLRPLFKSFEM